MNTLVFRYDRNYTLPKMRNAEKMSWEEGIRRLGPESLKILLKVLTHENVEMCRDTQEKSMYAFSQKGS